MKKLLILIPSMVSVGGTERMVHALSGLLSKAGFEVAQASFDAPGVRRHFESDTPLYGLGPIPRLPLALRPLAYALAAWRLRRLKQRLGTHVTISNLWGADLISVLSGGADRKLALCHINVVGNSTNRLMLRLLPLVAAVYRRFDRVIAVSEPLADELKTLYRLADGQSGHIDNFVDRPAAERGLPDDGRVGVAIRSFDPPALAAGLHALLSLAHAMFEALEAPHDRATPSARVQHFSIDRAVGRYLALLLPQATGCEASGRPRQ